MKRLFIAVVLLLVSSSAAIAGQAKTYGLFYYADWCSACKTLEPKVAGVKPEFADKPIQFLRIDLTNQERAEASIDRAREVGLGEVAQRNAQATGFLILVDGESKQIVDRIFANHSEQQIRQKLERALGS